MIEQATGIVGWAEWLRTGGMVGALGLAVKFYLDSRKMKIAEEVSDREGWGVLIRNLRDEVARLAEAHKSCEEGMHALRAEREQERADREREMAALRREIDGMRRELAQRDAAIIATMGPDSAAGQSALRAATEQAHGRRKVE